MKGTQHMPKHALTLPWDKFRGKISLPWSTAGLVLYDAPHAGNVSRQMVIPYNPNSPTQLLARSRISSSASAWKNLSAALAAQWRALAAQITRTNCLGFNYVLTGIAVFNMVNNYRLLHGEALTTTPPDLGDVPGPIPVTPDVYWDGLSLFIVLTPIDYPPTVRILARITPSIPSAARTLRRTELRLPMANPVLCWFAVTPGTAILECIPDTVSIDDAQWCGVECTAMSSDFLPRAPQFSSHLYVTAA
jgi:hypothetical protein